MGKSSFFAAFALFVLLAFGFNKIALAQPTGVPDWSHPNVFTYYSPGNTSMPAGSDLASKAVMLMDSYDDFLEVTAGTSGAIFPVRTFRDDNKECMCLSTHQIKKSSSGTPALGSTVYMLANLYNNYFGKDSLNPTGVAYNKTLGFDKTFVLTGELKEYIYDTANGADIALIWIDKRIFSSSTYVELGTDFSDQNWSDSFYSLSYPLSYPLRLNDRMTASTGLRDAVYLYVTEPYSIANQSAGAPFISRSATAPNISARGVLSMPRVQKDIYTLVNNIPTKLAYNTRVVSTKMKLLESAIREHCWNKRDSANISTNEFYKRALEIDNTLFANAFGTNQALSSSSQLTGATTSSIFSINTPENIKSTTIKANNCSFDNANGFTIPTVYPGTTNPWRVQVLAKTVDVKPGFEYTASGDALLSLGTVVLTSTHSTSRQLPTDTDENGIHNNESVMSKDPGSFNVYPNPSATGIFSLDLPGHIDKDKVESYRLIVHSADGKLISQSEKAQPGLRCQINLSGFSRGSYFLSVYRNTGKMVYSAVLIY